MYTIYCHIFPNGKRYVGLTRTSVDRRWGKGENYTSCPLVYRAIQKYGWDSVSHEILATCGSLEEAEALERHYIERFDTQNPKKGYNVLPGGDVSDNCATEEMRHKLGNGQRGKSRTETEKQKISQGVRETFSRKESNGHFGMRASDGTRKRMSDAQRDRWADNPTLREEARTRMNERMADPEYRDKVLSNLSKYQRKPGEWKMPEEAKEKLSEKAKGRWVGEKSPCSKAVLQYTVDGKFLKRWANAGEVERAGIASRSNVSKCCRGVAHIKTVGGFVWKFE